MNVEIEPIGTSGGSVGDGGGRAGGGRNGTGEEENMQELGSGAREARGKEKDKEKGCCTIL